MAATAVSSLIGLSRGSQIETTLNTLDMSTLGRESYTVTRVDVHPSKSVGKLEKSSFCRKAVDVRRRIGEGIKDPVR